MTPTSPTFDDVAIGDELPTLEIAADPHADRRRRDRVARLPGRPPRSRPRTRARIEGHHHEHPHHERLRRPLRHRLGRARRRDPLGEGAARRPQLPGRHDDA